MHLKSMFYVGLRKIREGNASLLTGLASVIMVLSVKGVIKTNKEVGKRI